MIRTTALAAATAVLLSGCGAHQETAQPRAAALCRTPELSVALDAGQAGGAAGSNYIPLTFTNKSRDSCELRGYPDVSFVAGDGGQQIGSAAAREPGYQVTRVTIGAGGSAHAWLRIAAAQNYPPAACGQVTAPALRVYPPGNTIPVYLRHSFAACHSPATRTLSVLPVREGQGHRGAIP